jgi:hypothetical protein
MEDELYLDARDVNELLEYCKSEIQYRSGRQPRPSPDREPQSTATGQQLSKYERKIQEHDDKTRDKLGSLEEKHQQELQDFEVEWREVMPDRYRHPSGALIELRQIARNLAAVDRFEEAQARKLEADRLEQREIEEAQARLKYDFQQAKRKLIARQQEEVAQLQATAQQQRDLLVSKRNGTQRAFANRMNVLEVKPQVKGRQPVAQGSTRASGVRTSPKKTVEYRLPPLQPPNGSPGQSRSVSRGEATE